MPPYHAELNPIELVWADVKEYIRSRNTVFKLESLKNLLEEAINHITSEVWKFWQLDEFMEVAIEPIIIRLSSDDDASDEEHL